MKHPKHLSVMVVIAVAVLVLTQPTEIHAKKKFKICTRKVQVLCDREVWDNYVPCRSNPKDRLTGEFVTTLHSGQHGVKWRATLGHGQIYLVFVNKQWGFAERYQGSTICLKQMGKLKCK